MEVETRVGKREGGRKGQRMYEVEKSKAAGRVRERERVVGLSERGPQEEGREGICWSAGGRGGSGKEGGGR